MVCDSYNKLSRIEHCDNEEGNDPLKDHWNVVVGSFFLFFLHLTREKLLLLHVYNTTPHASLH